MHSRVTMIGSGKPASHYDESRKLAADSLRIEFEK